mgnify:CR=1 FL=1
MQRLTFLFCIFRIIMVLVLNIFHTLNVIVWFIKNVSNVWSFPHIIKRHKIWFVYNSVPLHAYSYFSLNSIILLLTMKINIKQFISFAKNCLPQKKFRLNYKSVHCFVLRLRISYSYTCRDFIMPVKDWTF